MANRPCMLNSSVQAASTAASTTGRYSGRQPAITALTATFSTVHSTRSGGTTATTSSGARVVPSSMRRTRASVGGTTGRPSVQPRSNRASNSSSRAASSMRRLRRTLPPKRTASSSLRFGSTLREPHPGRQSGRSGPSPVRPVNASHCPRSQPTVRAASSPCSKRRRVGTVSRSWCQEKSRSVSSTTSTPSGKPGSSWLRTTRPVRSARSASTGATSTQVGQSRLTTATSPSRTIVGGVTG